ncbi:MAG: CAP domain-containing protein [Actinomycetota bacterium]
MSLRTKMLLGTAIVAASWVASISSAWASGEESCFTSRTNSARISAGVAPLTTRGDLVSIARRHSSQMAASGTIFHNGNLANEAPSDWQALGENVGMGPTCDDIHTAFMNSPHHRANILDSQFNYVGIGVVVASDGTIYVTEVFMKASGGTTTPTAPVARPRRVTAPTKPRATQPAPAAPAPEPSPSPSPPPGSKVTGKMAAYFDFLRGEDFPSDQTRARYHPESAPADDFDFYSIASTRGSLFDEIATFLGGVLAGGS